MGTDDEQVSVTFNMPRAMIEAIDAWARAEHRNRSQQFRLIVDQALEARRESASVAAKASG